MIRFTLLIVLTLASTANAQLTFTPHDPGITPHLTAYKKANPSSWWSWGLRLHDIDGDGKLDIYINTHSKNHGLYYKQGDDLQFSLADTGFHPSEMPAGRPPIFGDFTNSGFTDILRVGTNTTNASKVQTAEGFVDASYDAQSEVAHEIIDVDGDGFMDLITGARGWGMREKVTQINLAPDSLSFEGIREQVPIPDDLPQELKDRLAAAEVDTSEQNRFAGPQYWEGDLNGDGTEDMIVQYGGSYSPIRWGAYLIRNAEGVLEDVTETCGIPSTLLPIFPPADTAGNGKLSVLVGYGSLSLAGLYVQNDDNTWTRQSDGRTIHYTKTMERATYATNAPYFYQPNWLDLDGDGDLDCVISARRLGWLRVYENVLGVMQEQYHIGHWDADGYDIGDVNGDGKPDIAIGNVVAGQSKHSGTAVMLWLNTTNYTPPVDPEDPTDPEEPTPLVTRLTIDGVSSAKQVEVLLDGETVGVAGQELDVIIGEAPPVDPEDPVDPDCPENPPVDPEDPTDPEDPPVDPEDPTSILITPDTINLLVNAQDGQSFTMQAGTYAPFVLLRKNNLTIKASGDVLVTGRGPQYYPNAISVRESHHITFDGLECTHGNAGIWGFKSDFLVVRNCKLHDNKNFGLFTSFCDDTLAENNIIYDNWEIEFPDAGQHGIYISNSSQRPVLLNNKCTGHRRAGIQINADRYNIGASESPGITRGAIVRGNILTENRIGINLDGCSDSLFEGNRIDDGMRFFKEDGGEASSRNTIRNNYIFEKREQSTVWVRDGSKDNVFESNIIEVPMTHPPLVHAISVEEGDRGSSIISRNNTFIIPGTYPFGGGTYGKDHRTLEDFGDQGSVVR